ncbi:UspA [Macleaya cordata]|uniref:UspA n=1 Tax=Macleaya cordata TaxID=56857 RepID=A0A200R2H3_MACCD|nr:UspA [Macleaya cordata]
MGRTSSSTSRFQVSYLNSASTRFRIGSRPIQAKLTKSGSRKKVGMAMKKEFGDYRKPKFVVGRKIMVVVDLGFEAKSAIQWALSHTVQCQDTIVLVHVTKPNCKQWSSEREMMSPRAYELLYSIKNICHMERPEVKVEVAFVEGKEKGPTIVQEARKQGVSLLILGQRKRSISWRLLQMWRRKRNGGGVVEYCIENANCMAIGVRRKSRKLGGYLITTKLHKNFWLLA